MFFFNKQKLLINSKTNNKKHSLLLGIFSNFLHFFNYVYYDSGVRLEKTVVNQRVSLNLGPKLLKRNGQSIINVRSSFTTLAAVNFVEKRGGGWVVHMCILMLHTHIFWKVNRFSYLIHLSGKHYLTQNKMFCRSVNYNLSIFSVYICGNVPL